MSFLRCHQKNYCVGCHLRGDLMYLLPVLLSPNSKGQEIAKERNHTTAIITATLLLELYLVL